QPSEGEQRRIRAHREGSWGGNSNMLRQLGAYAREAAFRRAEQLPLAYARATIPGEQDMGLSVEDQLAIDQLYARYNHAIDAGKGETWAGCFTPDGTFKSGPLDLAGSEKLAEFATAFPTRLKARHWITNLLIE